QHRSGVQRGGRRAEKRLDLKSCPSLRRSTGGKIAHVNDAERRGHPFRGLETFAGATSRPGKHQPKDGSRFLSSKQGCLKASEVSSSASPTSNRSPGDAPRPSGRSAPSSR